VRFFGICPLAQPSPVRIKQCDKRVSLFFVAGSRWYAADSLPWHVASEVQVSESNQAERRILRRADVEARCGFKRAHLYKLIRDGKFPRPLRIGIRAVGWDSIDVDQWIAEQLRGAPSQEDANAQLRRQRLRAESRVRRCAARKGRAGRFFSRSRWISTDETAA
jgi:prophage regulatory protein